MGICGGNGQVISGNGSLISIKHEKVTKQSEDFEILAQKYGLNASDQSAIRERVAEELLRYAGKGRSDEAGTTT